MALIIKDAVFNYVHIKTPVLEFEAKADPAKEHMNKEYIVDVLMPLASWKKFKKHYKKVSSIEKAKTFTAAEYEAAFKVSPPDAKVYADEDGDYTVIKFRQRAYYVNSGDATKQPQIVGVTKMKNGNGDVIGYADGEGQAVGVDIAVGNGSVGVLQFRERTWKFGGKDGLSLDLVALQVTKLVPYEADDLAFDMDEVEVDGDSPFEGGTPIDDGDTTTDTERGSSDKKEEEDDTW